MVGHVFVSLLDFFSMTDNALTGKVLRPTCGSAHSSNAESLRVSLSFPLLLLILIVLNCIALSCPLVKWMLLHNYCAASIRHIGCPMSLWNIYVPESSRMSKSRYEYKICCLQLCPVSGNGYRHLQSHQTEGQVIWVSITTFIFITQIVHLLVFWRTGYLICIHAYVYLYIP